MRRVTKTFTISREMVERFADLTGDRTPCTWTRRSHDGSGIGSQVVHGMLPFSFIVCLEDAFPGSSLTFTALDRALSRAVFTGVTVRLEADATAARERHSASSRPNGQESRRREPDRGLRHCSGWALARSASALDSANGSSLLTEDVSENAYVIDELEGKSESLSVLSGSACWPDSRRCCSGRLSAATITASAPISPRRFSCRPLVGMRLPGRYATFTPFKASFERPFSPAVPGSLSGPSTRVSGPASRSPFRRRSPKAGETIGSAQLKVVVNPPPRKMIDCETIKERYLDMGVRGKVAVITGSSRGIGETAAKLFAMHGARTVVHYYRGDATRRPSSKEIRTAGGTALALGCDVRDEHQVARLFADVLDAYGRVDILVNNAVKEFRLDDVPEPALGGLPRGARSVVEGDAQLLS